jgi:hypothetical protein
MFTSEKKFALSGLMFAFAAATDYAAYSAHHKSEALTEPTRIAAEKKFLWGAAALAALAVSTGAGIAGGYAASSGLLDLRRRRTQNQEGLKTSSPVKRQP